LTTHECSSYIKHANSLRYLLREKATYASFFLFLQKTDDRLVAG
jgi:hypothetical protein